MDGSKYIKYLIFIIISTSPFGCEPPEKLFNYPIATPGPGKYGNYFIYAPSNINNKWTLCDSNNSIILQGGRIDIAEWELDQFETVTKNKVQRLQQVENILDVPLIRNLIRYSQQTQLEYEALMLSLEINQRKEIKNELIEQTEMIRRLVNPKIKANKSEDSPGGKLLKWFGIVK